MQILSIVSNHLLLVPSTYNVHVAKIPHSEAYTCKHNNYEQIHTFKYSHEHVHLNTTITKGQTHTCKHNSQITNEHMQSEKNIHIDTILTKKNM